jgi:peptidoglycan LD-endopeptidase LytH
VQEAYARRDELVDEIAALEADIAATQQQVDELQARADDRAVTAYVSGTISGVAALDVDSIMDSARRTTLLGNLAANDENVLDALTVANDDREAQERALQSLEAEQMEIAERLEQEVAEALAKLAEAQALEAEIAVKYEAELAAYRAAVEQARREQEARRAAEAAARQAEVDRQRRAQRDAERQRLAEEEAARNATSTTTLPPTGPDGSTLPPSTAAPGSTGGVNTEGAWLPTTAWSCPQPGAAFFDSWGAPRSGGRRHQGVDLMVPEGNDVIAVVDGSVNHQNGGLAGVGVWLHGDDGNTYFYAHLLEGSVKDGRVQRGSALGKSSDSGNARGVPHTHFEIHPGGGRAVNPYPAVRAYC